MGLILILAWMYSTSELDELFQILNLIEKDLNLKGLEPHWSNTTIITGGMNKGSYEPITGSVKFDVYN